MLLLLLLSYCEGGRCSTEGRALMQLDFQHLLFKLTHICQILPVPHADYVDGFIKAYYLPESGLEQWISNHSVSLNVFTFHTTRIWLMEYTAKQMIYLLGVATHVSKKAKTRIINALND
uniref:DUF2451 domain-containing protein n=1 Tax=Heterorhabditis bacteriophora TaxID=37862 RepID=A0A1I7WYB3_HETBA